MAAEIYVIGGGDWMRETLNAVAAFIHSDSWYYIRHVGTLAGVYVLMVQWIRTHDLMHLLTWVFVMVGVAVVVSSGPRVQVVDITNPRDVYVVDNVPLGITLPASLFTQFGMLMVRGYEVVFSQPDVATYSQTGMLFGASLMARSTDFTAQNPELTDLFADYVQNCVIGDILLNRKYSLNELMNSTDPYTLIFSKPSPLRGLFGKDGKFMTCEQAAAPLKNMLGLEGQTGSPTWHYYARQLFGGKPDADLLFGQLLGNSYQYFYQNKNSASDIIKQNVVMNGLRSGILSYASRSNDTAGMLNIATTSALEKQRLSQATMGQVAMRMLPTLHVVMMGIMMGVFPMIILVGLVNQGWQVFKGYVFAWLWLMSWPLLYAILNSAMTFYARKMGSPVVLANLSVVQLNYSDIATTAGYISMFIPFISWYIAIGLGNALNSIGHSFNNAAAGASSAAASTTTDANYSFNNMQSDNVTGSTWDTNSVVRTGQMTKQLGTGGSQTRTADGSQVFDATGSTSRIPVDIGVTRQISTAQQQMAREAESQAETAMHGFNSNISSAWTQLSQFTGQRGSSDTMTSGADTAQNSQSSIAAHKMASAVDSYAKANNISHEQATSELAQRSGDVSWGWDARAGVRGSAGLSVLGNGVTAEGYAGAHVGGKQSDTDSHSASSGTRGSNDARHDQSAQAAADFKEGMDYLTSHRTSQSGGHTDNNADSRIDQLSASLAGAKSSYEQYSSAHTRSHELSEQASRTESLSGDMRENLSQQFAQYVMQRSPDDAGNILTGHSSEAAAARQQLAREFVRDQVAPQVDAQYQSNRQGLGASMGSVSGGGGSGGINKDYQNHQGEIEKRTVEAGIKNNVSEQVGGMMKDNYEAQGNVQDKISGQKENIDISRNNLKQNHADESKIQNDKYIKEVDNQKLLRASQDKSISRGKAQADKASKESD
ncbi:conjugal transfer mating-pair stabilization protein TraG [Serratia marcescens]|uniref:conjugal transfer mating-pair stabilization protein TraG n=1 Tax=Serratia marcescens TaxID=615 RepID=UPI000744FDEF|nr:conjugal transfer mating-pair stabilization protein TraG [Serratia marcescens]CVG62870.1 conjugal transfer mating pair stabilization protein TraG [Serratia marcescens]